MLTIALGAEDLATTRFAISPLWEAIASLRQLRRPRSAEFAPWRREVARRVAGTELRPLFDLVPDEERGIPHELVPVPLGSGPDFATELRDMAGDDADLTGRLRRYWNAAVAPHWPAIRRVNERDIFYRTRMLVEGGFAAVFSDLSEQVSYRDGVLSVRHRRFSGDVALEGRGLVLVPSVFAGDSVHSYVHPPGTAVLRYRPRGTAELWNSGPREPTEALAALLGRGRAAVLTALADPATTTGLAEATGLTPGAVSQHLKVLHAAGVVRRFRVGRYVHYSRTTAGEAIASSAAGS
ncbi:ArsR/SmtB family transcription factor [Salininema proteolyticum]|uniref:ArsR/SmtB family transcription factor n=1 Tax=Salininema proteolyticum TaxID=1607685 RepID=A0ABV8U4X6_9ACTN